MKQTFAKISALALAAMLMATSFAGCANKPKKDHDFYIFNTKGENAAALQAAADAYGAEKNVKVKVFSLGSGTNSDDTLRAEMNSDDKPAIFCTMNANSLVEWKEGGFALELGKAKNEAFKKLASEIPNDFKLTSDGTDSYGIPFNVEGYGYIVDKEMLASLFGEAKVMDVLASFKAATYDEFAKAVTDLTAYIKNGTGADIALAGAKYPLAATKTGKASTLQAVFSMAGSQKWTYGDHLLNVAIDAVFPTSHAAAKATSGEVDKLKGAFIAYAKTLDLKSTNAIGSRGAEFINDATNGYDASVQNFADSKAIFLKQGNWAYTNIEKANASIVANLTFIPVKMPFTSADVVAEGFTVDKINSSIPVFVPNYYLINQKVSEKEQEMAQDFLVWLNTSTTGQKFVTEDMAFIPYNSDPANTTVSNSLGSSIVEYMNTGNTTTNAYAGSPNTWPGDVVGQEVMEKYLIKAEWSDADYSAIADFAIAKWKELAKLK